MFSVWFFAEKKKYQALWVQTSQGGKVMLLKGDGRIDYFNESHRDC
jgi:hypothetical protein